jgi:ABC-type sugar transport system ATPase subunit
VTAALRAEQVRKTYGGTVALHGADMVVEAGSVHALLGENGAGKSTLVKILTGAVRPDRGSVLLDGEPMSFASTADAGRRGIAVVAQELALFPDTDVLTNIFPGRGPRRGPFMDRRRMRQIAEPVLDQLGLRVSTSELLGNLTLAQRQLVEIARALVTDPRVLVLDEPTSALEHGASARLVSVLKVLRDRGVAVVFVSHILEEVMNLCDRVTVLRDGKVVVPGDPIADHGVKGIVRAMIGDEPRQREQARAAETRLSSSDALEETPDNPGVRLDAVTVPGVLDGVTLAARGGQIVGLAGLAGSGHDAVLEVIAGRRKLQSGTVRLPDGGPVPRNVRDAIGRGVAFVSGDRRRYGLMLDKPLWENIAQVRAIARGDEGLLLPPSKLRRRAEQYLTLLNIKAPSVDLDAGMLSGGNQQKVVFAKWLETEPRVLLLDDPTRGVDVGAKAEMHGIMRSIAESGAAVFLCSTDLEELAAVCERVYVFYHGRTAVDLGGDTLDEDQLLVAMNTGRVDDAGAVAAR